MTNRTIAVILFFALFFPAFYVVGIWSTIMIILAFVIISTVSVYDWVRMLKIEKDILVKFKIEYNQEKRIKDGITWFLIASVAILLIYFFSVNADYYPNNSPHFNGPLIWTFIIILNVSNIVYHNRFFNCVLTKDGLFMTRQVKTFDFKSYDDYHYEVEHNSFILSKDGVETMELIPKTPIEPYADVLIDLLDNGIEKEL